MKIIRYGPDAILLQFAKHIDDEAFARGCAIAAELEQRSPPWLVDFVPAFTTVLLEFQKGFNVSAALPELVDQLERVAAHTPPLKPVKEIPVIYDGPDLARVAETSSLSLEEVCQRHAAPIYRVYMIGFSPGFPYLGGLDPKLHTPRLSSPRPWVRAGSVAIGGEHTGIYSIDSPGGWNIVGRTTWKVFDPLRVEPEGDNEAMFLLKHGDRVKFVPVNPTDHR